MTVWGGKGVPNAAGGPVLAIKAVNVSGAPVKVTEAYAGSIYTSLPMETLFGSRTVKFPLRVLKGEWQPPCVLQVGETALWTASLRQLIDELEEDRSPLVSVPRDLGFDAMGVGDLTRRELLTAMVRNRIRNRVAILKQRDLAVIVGDELGGFHKAAVRWQSPHWAVLRRRRFPSAVTEVEIFEDLLVIYPRGAEGVSLFLDLAHVVSAEADPEIAHAALEKSDDLDIGPPDVPTGPPFLPEGDTALFNVHDPEQTVMIGLRSERYSRLVIQVENPTTVVASIREAIGKATDST